MAVSSTFNINEKKLTENENKEIDEPVIALDESSINNLKYYIRGVGDHVVRIGEMINGVIQSIGCFQGNITENSRKKFVTMEFGDLFELATGPLVGMNMTMANISKLALRVDLSVSTDRSNKQFERLENEKGEIFHKEKQSCIQCKHETEAETRLEKDIKDKGKATLKSNPRVMDLAALREILKLSLFSLDLVYSKPDSYHQYPIILTGWDLDKSRQHDAHSAVRRIKRHAWTMKPFRPPVIEVGQWYQVGPRYCHPFAHIQKRRLQREHAAAQNGIEEREKAITGVKKVDNGKDGIVYPLIETSSSKDDVTANSSAKTFKDKDRMIDPLDKISKAKQADSLAKTSKVEALDFTVDKISSATNDDKLLKELESQLYRMEGHPNPMKKLTFKVEKRFKWVPKEKKNDL
ncbi:hypothetical protein FNV43_RR05677 [Rhamnella rubrinervis]|uniref:Uncharacterized protein n=1 Tax=Rhamnella rubrinervis TaxID=2594499 RepID=A0A8K0HN27_9ROSA|nr:hypothetical protein FNV43_RR05677 [Rhamnella rubrinervis]